LIVSTSSGALRDPDIVRVTRDRINGAPADWVGLWSTRPWLEDIRGNLRWCGAPAPDGPVGWLGNLTVPHAEREYGKVPRDHDQVLIVRLRDPEDRARVEALLDGISTRTARLR
jgi:hypothetical protein